MRVVIVGAGAIGKQLSKVLCYWKNDVVLIDQKPVLLEEIKNELDIMTLTGNGASVQILLKAGIKKTDLLLAVSNNSEANILACNLAKFFNVPLKIARIRSAGYFDDAHGLSAEGFGVDHMIIPEYECAGNIMDAILHPTIKETVQFSNPHAQLVNFQVKPDSLLTNTQLNAFPKPKLLQQLRICAIVRYGQLIIPRGKTKFLNFDEVYVAGTQGAVDEFISWSEPDSKSISKVIISGMNHLSFLLSSMLMAADINVCILESKALQMKRSSEFIDTGVFIIQGDSSDVSVLEEAGIDNCDAFIAASTDDENNILSCILAKRHGARKVIAVTNNLESLDILSSMHMIDCVFNPHIATINSMIKYISHENRQTVALLKRTTAEIIEMLVRENSPVAGKTIQAIECPETVVFAFILRGDKIIPAIGSERMMVDDHVIILASPEAVTAVERLFRPNSFWK